MAKWVPVQPSCAALWFIRSAKAETLPEICSARPFATSLADFKSRAYKLCSTVSWSPAVRLMVTAPDSRFVVAVSEKVTISSRLQFSTVRRAVITLVMLAGKNCVEEFFSKRICPVLQFKSTAPSADTVGAATEAEPAKTVPSRDWSPVCWACPPGPFVWAWLPGWVWLPACVWSSPEREAPGPKAICDEPAFTAPGPSVETEAEVSPPGPWEETEVCCCPPVSGLGSTITSAAPAVLVHNNVTAAAAQNSRLIFLIIRFPPCLYRFLYAYESS